MLRGRAACVRRRERSGHRRAGALVFERLEDLRGASEGVELALGEAAGELVRVERGRGGRAEGWRGDGSWMGGFEEVEEEEVEGGRKIQVCPKCHRSKRASKTKNNYKTRPPPHLAWADAAGGMEASPAACC